MRNQNILALILSWAGLSSSRFFLLECVETGTFKNSLLCIQCMWFIHYFYYFPYFLTGLAFCLYQHFSAKSEHREECFQVTPLLYVISCCIPHKNKLTKINTSTFILIEGRMLREREGSGKEHQDFSLDIWGKEHYYSQLEAWAEI